MSPESATRFNRRNLRWPTHDYTSHSAYFITVVTLDRATLLGRVESETMVLSDTGAAVLRCWNALPARFSAIDLDEMVVMPNHLHGIIWIRREGDGDDVPSLGAVVGAFKSLSARAANEILGRTGSFWQRNYFERVMRDERELQWARQYIIDNPVRWAMDRENPERA